MINAIGRQLKAAIQLYMQRHGTTVAGRKIELTIHGQAHADLSGRRRDGQESRLMRSWRCPRGLSCAAFWYRLRLWEEIVESHQ
jgi:hypothetical protein